MRKKHIRFCYYCGKNATTLDHKIPKSQGGGGKENLVPACFRCNQMKANLTDYEFFKWLFDIVEWQIMRRYR
jgi:5-methylcytosine-specific restriction endonuclease McrA